MNMYSEHRLEGLEPENLLAFLALLGVLRALEETDKEWFPKVAWTVNKPPVRPALRVYGPNVTSDDIVAKVAEGLNNLASHHDFDGSKDLNFKPETATNKLIAASKEHRYIADLWSALVSNAAISRDGRKVEPTPLCLLHGQGHQHFLERLDLVPRRKCPPDRGRGRGKIRVSEHDCLYEALFIPWHREDATDSFRWDPNEDVRYALRATNPTNRATKEKTQHGANRLAAIGLSVLTVVPERKLNRVFLNVLGGRRGNRRRFAFCWPIWIHPISLAAICALLNHPKLTDMYVQRMLGIYEYRCAQKISSGRYMNFTQSSPTGRRRASRMP